MTNNVGSPLDCVIGEETHLDDADHQVLLQLASLDAMRRAVALGLGVEGAQVLQVLLIIWQRPSRMRSARSYFVSTLDAHLADLTGLDEMHVNEGLRQLVGFVRVNDLDLYLSGDVELSLEPLLNGGDGELAKRLDSFWRTSYARRRMEAVSEAEDAIDVYLAQADTRASANARERLTMLQARWARFAANRRFKTPLDVQEVLSHLPEFEAEVTELAAIHDGLTGLLARTDEYAMLFAERHPVSTGSRLQAMRARPQVMERPVVRGRDRLVVVK